MNLCDVCQEPIIGKELEIVDPETGGYFIMCRECYDYEMEKEYEADGETKEDYR